MVLRWALHFASGNSLFSGVLILVGGDEFHEAQGILEGPAIYPPCRCLVHRPFGDAFPLVGVRRVGSEFRRVAGDAQTSARSRTIPSS